jgi:hypothetical protein
MLVICHLEATVRAQANPCENHGGQSGTGTEFSPKTLIFPLIVISPLLNIHISFIYHRRYIILANNTIHQGLSV